MSVVFSAKIKKMTDTTTIQLTGKHGLGKVATVDTKHLPLLSQFAWRTNEAGQVYATVHLARLVLALEENENNRGQDVDHKDRNPFNNTASNLRRASRAENIANRGLFSTNKSGYIGVYWVESRKKWKASYGRGKNAVFCGHYDCKIDAARAYNKALMKRKDIREEFKMYNDV